MHSQPYDNHYELRQVLIQEDSFLSILAVYDHLYLKEYYEFCILHQQHQELSLQPYMVEMLRRSTNQTDLLLEHGLLEQCFQVPMQHILPIPKLLPRE